MSQLAKPLATLKSSIPTHLNFSAFIDRFKPPKGEAIARLRANMLGLVTLTIVTYLLPLPTPWESIAVVRRREEVSMIWYGLCAIETLLLSFFSFNILQASYALKYPRTSIPLPPPPPSPAKSLKTSPPTRKWNLAASTRPQVSPRPQKAFTYAASPISTPSRTLSYTLPPSASSSFDSSFSTSMGSIPGSPSSPLAAYRGKYSRTSGRALNGSLLSRLSQAADDDDE
ncbi:uncharacterized protein LAESUDRAFT_645525 [Laetiporus sulphureus 93-53]|uniref:Uncharacterized protein n=1 Tax=Laetiporus sulphureus 93-53 TaxID=1314785 RepID=A0A165GDC7_9APHY|nr:uncharacterized protein LAESUDRAFT_645525 [Laetiporus sulphureus 93-53]KZT10192.1 hypothetical protein LAESUDRAFT_645525 [Laetiporus sulphureus 93-53]